MRTAHNCCRCDEVATTSSGGSGRDAEADFWALKVALGSMEDFGGSADKEEEEFVVTDFVDSTVDVDKVNVDDVEESPACGWDWGMPVSKGDKELKKRKMSWFEEENGY